MISFKNVTKTFARLPALQGINLEIAAAKSYALVGPNGSGKTTLIKCLLGLVIPSSGEIIFDGKKISNDWKYRQYIGYMPQIGRYPDNISIGQLVEMMKNIRPDQNKIDDELIDAFKLYKIFDKKMHALSGGTRQKVSAALAFLFNAPVLILDEPTAGLDPISAEILKEKIQQERTKGKLMLISSHILNDLDELATDIAYIYEGSLQYHNTISALKKETNEKRLGKAIATLIRQKELLDSLTK
jgi:Cu-processing system ATP-binding protein